MIDAYYREFTRSISLPCVSPPPPRTVLPSALTYSHLLTCCRAQDDASDGDEDDGPQSVAELMAALERHGVNTVDTAEDAADPADPDGDLADPGGDPAAGEVPAAAAARRKESDPSQWPEGALEVRARA